MFDSFSVKMCGTDRVVDFMEDDDMSSKVKDFFETEGVFILNVGKRVLNVVLRV